VDYTFLDFIAEFEVSIDIFPCNSHDCSLDCYRIAAESDGRPHVDGSRAFGPLQQMLEFRLRRSMGHRR
jgi:hypothetical protein